MEVLTKKITKLNQQLTNSIQGSFRSRSHAHQLLTKLVTGKSKVPSKKWGLNNNKKPQNCLPRFKNNLQWRIALIHLLCHLKPWKRPQQLCSHRRKEVCLVGPNIITREVYLKRQVASSLLNKILQMFNKIKRSPNRLASKSKDTSGVVTPSYLKMLREQVNNVAIYSGSNNLIGKYSSRGDPFRQSAYPVTT